MTDFKDQVELKKDDKAIELLKSIVHLNSIGSAGESAMDFLICEIKGYINDNT